MNQKNIGVIAIVIGIIMLVYTGFNFVTKEKVAEIGPIKIEKEENHPVQWSPVVGIVLVIGGSLLMFTGRNK